MGNMQIPIVVVAFNRLSSLKRILTSLDRSTYPSQVKLIVSIDGGGSQEVVDFANQFQWKYGEKEIIQHQHNLGLRAHIIKCGQLALKYDGIVLLEDDLYVSPDFYQFMLAAQEQYASDENISGVALYSPGYNETACLPFIPIADGNEVFFMQLACSWGQSWLSKQWQEFESWYENNKNLVLQNDSSLPPDVKLWPDSSWKKYFIKYNIENEKFFAYPRASFTTNFADSGENHAKTRLWQVPIALGANSSRLPNFSDSIAKYDAFCEILPDSLKNQVKELQNYDFSVDLYGLKDRESIHTEYVLTRNKIQDHLLSFGCEIKPHELNIIDNFPGEHFSLGKTENMLKPSSFLGHRYRIFADYKETHGYFYAFTPEHRNEFAKDVRKQCEEENAQADAAKHFSNSVGNPQKHLKNGSEELATESNQLLADIEYLNSSIRNELESVRNQFQKLIKDQPAQEIKLNLVINEVSGTLAQLNTRIDLVEYVINGDKDIKSISVFKENCDQEVASYAYLPEVTINAGELSQYDNMESLQKAKNGSAYCWSGADKDIEFNLAVQRDVKKQLTITIHSLIKPDFGKSMQIFIDGKHIRHSFRMSGDIYTVICTLPPQRASRETKIRISLPGTFSPMELGHSDDQRKLGIAISEIRFNNPKSRFGFFHNRKRSEP